MLPFPVIDDFPDTEPMAFDLLSRDCNDVRADVRNLAASDPMGVIKSQNLAVAELITELWGTQQLHNLFTGWMLGSVGGSNSWSSALRTAVLEMASRHAENFSF